MSRPASPREQAMERLSELAALGLDGWPRREEAARPSGPIPSVSGQVPSASGQVPSVSGQIPSVSGQIPSADLVAGLDLAQMREALVDCQRCRLCEQRTQVVFGVGHPTARLMFVGEGPGRDEDLQGEPFVGRAGQLLTDMIEKGMGLRRADVYIANVVKCRPPENRNPQPDEVASCSPFLKAQVALVQPEVIVALGKFAAQALLACETPISRLRGQWHEYEGIALMPTFHPAYLLRDPSQKRLAWADLQLVMARLAR